jgi:hypothetical protein
MSRQFAYSNHMPCPQCGASVATDERDDHTCDPERQVEYELFQLREEMACFDASLTDWLQTPEGLFAQWLAERDR